MDLKNRILSKIIAMTLIQYINKFEFNRNINNTSSVLILLKIKMINFEII